MEYHSPSTLKSLNDMKEFDPARGWLWDLMFHYHPFNDSSNAKYAEVDLKDKIPTKLFGWVPADSLNRVVAVVESMDVQVGQTNFKIASGSSSLDITINFIDNYKQEIKDWIDCWMNNIILTNGNGVNWMTKLVDTLTIYDYLPDGTTRKQYDLIVYPDGPLSEQNTSDSSIKVYSQNFVVCGKG